jgi:6-bladed beta-propeller
MKKRPFGLSAILGTGILLFFWLPGCKKKEAAQAKTETIDGVTYIHNPAAPLHPRRAVVFEEDLTFKEKDETGEIRLYKPGRYTVDARGNLYIEDDSDMGIKVFDPRGKYLRTIGRKGNGPGEFGQISDMALLPGGRLLVTDFEARRTSFFNPEGQFLSSFQWKKFFSQVYLVTDSSYTVADMVVNEKARELWVKTIDFNGEEILTFGKFSYPEFKMLQQGEITFSTSVPWSPMSIFAGDRTRQWLYHCLNNKYLIEIYDQKGQLFRKIDRPYELVPVTGEDIKQIRSEYADRPDSPFAKLVEQMAFPKVKTVTDRMLVDDDGNLWVETNEEKKRPGAADRENKAEGNPIRAYDIFSPEGIFESRVWTDIRPGLFANGKMYRSVEDEQTGLRQIKRYRVIWKDS